jgi:hypothetical protein
LSNSGPFWPRRAQTASWSPCAPSGALEPSDAVAKTVTDWPAATLTVAVADRKP